ncbi:ammonium transporter [Collibacillus ludicampi]|uniref:Ammonium transporter n=2 Tax=Collibacillus ludicampi TaxID=2771369 RepID=A0AAV4LGI7_9BACL|nr:ammonium transporter [Collibacillus ludicampi]GIM46759.1 ammonium transporter [Collibacillus ludicampi]
MKRTISWMSGMMLLATPGLALAADEPTVKDAIQAVDTVWVLVAAVLVFLMQAGFALLEAGATRMKNAGHIAGKNVLSFAIVTLVFWAVGFAISFGQGNNYIGMSGWFLNVAEDKVNDIFASLSFSSVPLGAKFLFQVVFAGVSLAIMWGGIAERAKLIVYFVFGTLFTAIIYPVIAHWVWGGGWLSTLGMQDFAGSTVVHLQGGVAALVGAILLGPRIGKYNKDGTANVILGHNTVYSVLGVIILWFGWFGFNAGSTLMANGVFFPYVAMTTNLAAAAGAVAALLTAWVVLRKPDIGYMLNGVLAALVAITASCAFVKPWAAVVIGALAGIFMVISVLFFDRILRIDDPVGAFSVHGMAGIWGTLSTGFFAAPDLVQKLGVGQPGLFYGGGWHQLGIQFLGIAVSFAFVFVASFLILYAIKVTVGLRISREEEIIGLDVSEHGVSGYPEQLPHGGDYHPGSNMEFRPTHLA